MGKEAKVCKCYIYASLMRVIWLIFQCAISQTTIGSSYQFRQTLTSTSGSFVISPRPPGLESPPPYFGHQHYMFSCMFWPGSTHFSLSKDPVPRPFFPDSPVLFSALMLGWKGSFNTYPKHFLHPHPLFHLNSPGN